MIHFAGICTQCVRTRLITKRVLTNYAWYTTKRLYAKKKKLSKKKKTESASLAKTLFDDLVDQPSNTQESSQTHQATSQQDSKTKLELEEISPEEERLFDEFFQRATRNESQDSFTETETKGLENLFPQTSENDFDPLKEEEQILGIPNKPSSIDGIFKHYTDPKYSGKPLIITPEQQKVIEEDFKRWQYYNYEKPLLLLLDEDKEEQKLDVESSSELKNTTKIEVSNNTVSKKEITSDTSKSDAVKELTNKFIQTDEGSTTSKQDQHKIERDYTYYQEKVKKMLEKSKNKELAKQIDPALRKEKRKNRASQSDETQKKEQDKEMQKQLRRLGLDLEDVKTHIPKTQEQPRLDKRLSQEKRIQMHSERLRITLQRVLDELNRDRRIANVQIKYALLSKDYRIAKVKWEPGIGIFTKPQLEKMNEVLQKASGYFSGIVTRTLEWKYAPKLIFYFDADPDAKDYEPTLTDEMYEEFARYGVDVEGKKEDDEFNFGDESFIDSFTTYKPEKEKSTKKKKKKRSKKK